MARKKKKEFKSVDFMTFSEMGDRRLRDLEGEHPWVFNDEVGVRRFRIRVELVDEPVSVIHERIIYLWERTSNHHRWGPLAAEAKRYGLDLSGYKFGCKAKRGD